MRKYILTLTSFVLASVTFAQSELEMLDNGGFEQVEGKIKKGGLVVLAKGWSSPTKTQADLFSAKVKEGYGTPNNPYGKEDPFEGENYAGITSFSYGDKEARTYISARLKTPMRSGLKYCVKFYVSLAEASKYASNNIAANFSKKQFNYDEDRNIMAESHVMAVGNPVFNATFGWDEVCGIYTAEGGEKFITIGNFSSNGDTKSERMAKNKEFTGQQVISSYYFVDNISVQLVKDESECDCKAKDEDAETSIVYAVSPVNPDGMKPEMVAKYTSVYFDKNKADLDANGEKHLDNIVTIMKENPSGKIKLKVHLDQNEANDNSTVDVDRAKAVKDYLTSNGVDASRISVENVKANDPADTSGSKLGNAKNRRIEFIYIP